MSPCEKNKIQNKEKENLRIGKEDSDSQLDQFFCDQFFSFVSQFSFANMPSQNINLTFLDNHIIVVKNV